MSRCSPVVALFRPHRAEDRQPAHLLRQLGKVLADLDARGDSLDLLEGTAVGVSGLEIERVHL